jgi:hypothetical protein
VPSRRDFIPKKDISGRFLGKQRITLSSVILPANHGPKSVIPRQKLFLGFPGLALRLTNVVGLFSPAYYTTHIMIYSFSIDGLKSTHTFSAMNYHGSEHLPRGCMIFCWIPRTVRAANGHNAVAAHKNVILLGTC